MNIRFSAIISFSIILLIGVSFYFLKYLEFAPKDRADISDRFLKLLVTNRLEEAYALTNENAIVGTSYDRFQKNVERELGRGDLADCDLSITGYYPKQSYGNRLRRLWNRSPVEVDQFHIEYDPCGIPFRISLRLNRNGEWKVVNFQSHAE